MGELIEASVEYPTFVLSILVGISMSYWVFVILGALDLDILGGGDSDIGGDAGGDIGDAGGDIGDAGGDIGDAGGDAGELGDGAASSTLLTGLGLRKVPLTISLTMLVIVAWVTSLLGNYYLAASFDGAIAIVIKTVVFALALVIGLLLAGVLVKPLAPFFKTHGARTRDSYVGSTCTIDTGNVDAKFGQAKIEEGGDVLVIPVRCDSENTLGRGAKALVIEYDTIREAYLVEPSIVEPSIVEPTKSLSTDKRN